MSLNWDRVQREYPYRAEAGAEHDLYEMFIWLIDNLQQPAVYRHKVGDWTRVWGKITKRLVRKSPFGSRRELFGFKNETDRTLFLVRWS